MDTESIEIHAAEEVEEAWKFQRIMIRAGFKPKKLIASGSR